MHEKIQKRREFRSLPAGDLNAVNFTVGHSTFMVGDLISNIINFLIIAFIVFLAYKQLSRFKLVEDKTKPAPADKK